MLQDWVFIERAHTWPPTIVKDGWMAALHLSNELRLHMQVPQVVLLPAVNQITLDTQLVAIP